MPPPMRRLSAAGLLLLSLLVGLYPVARLMLGDGPPSWPRVAVPQIGRITAVAAVAAVVAMLVAPIAPTIRLSLALGGFVVGFTTTAGAAMLAYQRWRGGERSRLPLRSPGRAGSDWPSPHLYSSVMRR